MGSVASELKSERQKRNISLAQIASDTRISLHYLESLEEGRYHDLPGGMYNRAFLRAYCERLNLNQQEILSRYEAEISPSLDRIPKSKIHLHQQNSSFKPSPVLIWSFMLLISAAGLFYSRKWIGAVFSPYFSRKPAVIAPHEIAQPPLPVPAAQQSAPIVAQARAPGPEPEAVPPESSYQTTPAQPNTPVSSSTSPASQEPDGSAPSAQLSLKLEVGISEKCWISIDRDGSPAIRRLMTPGEVQSLSAKEQFLLIVGNAGGAHLKINGRPAKPLGKSGEVVKILINERTLQDLLDRATG